MSPIFDYQCSECKANSTWIGKWDERPTAVPCKVCEKIAYLIIHTANFKINETNNHEGE